MSASNAGKPTGGDGAPPAAGAQSQPNNNASAASSSSAPPAAAGANAPSSSSSSSTAAAAVAAAPAVAATIAAAATSSSSKPAGERRDSQQSIAPVASTSKDRASDSAVDKRAGSDRGTGSLEDRLIIKANGVCYLAERIIGNGSFGVVFQAQVADTKEVVAIKKVLQDKRFKNRELQIMKLLAHPNVVALKNSFYTTGEKPDEVFLNLVLEFIPDTVYRVARNYSKVKQAVPILLVKLYTYQLARSLGYIHSQGICHRDIKPQNLLLDQTTGVLKLCDFGSAKMLVRGEPNVSYICSRYYRAPELIFGSTNYTTAIDIWSMGCVMAELLLGQPLFPGESGVDQLVEIIKILGTPTREQIEQMNQNYTEFKFPQIKPHPWTKVFRPRTPPEAIDLIVHLLNYTPTQRLKPLEALCHPFFDELRDPNTRLPSGRTLPPLFNFTAQELSSARHFSPGFDPSKLVPPHARAELPEAALAALDELVAARAASVPHDGAAAAASSATASGAAPGDAVSSAAAADERDADAEAK